MKKMLTVKEDVTFLGGHRLDADNLDAPGHKTVLYSCFSWLVLYAQFLRKVANQPQHVSDTYHGYSTMMSQCGQVDTSSCHIPPQVFVLWGINVTGLCWCYEGMPAEFCSVERCSVFFIVLILWLISDSFLFQRGSALVYKVRPRKNLFSKFGVEELDWPAQSPDLNPIPHLRDGLEC